MDAESYRREVAGRFADRLLALERRLEAEPAVAGVTIEGGLPGRRLVTLVEEMPGRTQRGVRAVGIGTDYFAVVGARMLAGRDFRPSDAAASGDGLIVNEAFVQKLLGGGPALGRRLGFMPETESWRPERVVPPPWLEVVGVVQDLTSSVLDSEWSVPFAYYAVAPGSLQSADVHVHVRGGDVNGFAPRFREITAALDPDLRIGYVANLGALQSPRLQAIGVAVILVVLGTVLLLSAAGIHALMSLTVTRRRREIGIRTALGADSSRLLARIFARAAWQLGLGGLVGSLLGAGLLLGNGAAWREASISLGGVVMLLLTAGLAAAVGPARRGLRIRPMEALKEE
jgi:hypothetical protein